jgi:toxin ParE1/3/4
MKYKVCILTSADADASDIFFYIAQDDREAAHRMREKIYAAMCILEHNPERGARIKDKVLSQLDFRFVIVSPYLIFYRIVGQEVHAHHIVHQRKSSISLLLDFIKSSDLLS